VRNVILQIQSKRFIVAYLNAVRYYRSVEMISINGICKP